MTTENDKMLWGKSAWTYYELKDAAIECAGTQGDQIKGWGTLLVRERPNGMQAISIENLIMNTETSVTRIVTQVPPCSFQYIVKHPDQTKTGFIFQAPTPWMHLAKAKYDYHC